MDFVIASPKHACRRVTRAGAGLRAPAAVAAITATMQGVAAPPPRSPGPGRP